MNVAGNRRWWVVTVTALASVVIALDTTILTVALPTLAADLHASTSQLQWMADSYLLTFGALLLPLGMLGDRIGRRRVLTGALVAFGVGSVWCAYAGSAASLIAARTLLGAGAAAVIPLTFSLLVTMFTPAERPLALGVLGGAGIIAMPLGPILGGALLDRFWWGSVFLVNVPVVVVTVIGCLALLPRDTPSPRPPST